MNTGKLYLLTNIIKLELVALIQYKSSESIGWRALKAKNCKEGYN
jgi:hypothetical protein